MLAADAQFEFGPRRTAPFGGDLHQFAHARDIDGDEGVARDQTLGEVLDRKSVV